MKVLIEAEVISQEHGYLLVRLDTGFGDPEIKIVEDKVLFPKTARIT